MTVVPLLLLLLLEGVLRVFGVGYPTRFFIPAERGTLTTNPKFAWQFYPRQSASAPTPVLLKKEKPAGVKRVFVFGESAAEGTPDPTFSFSRMLELMLEQQFPTNRVEIINAAVRGIDSHIIRQIAAECARLSPDLFIVYMGNNDMIGLHSPTPGEWNGLKRPALIRFEHAIKRTRIAQLFESGLRRSAAVPAKPRRQDMEFMRTQRLAFDDPARAVVYRNYRSNLESICKTAARAGAKTIVCSVGVNLHDLPPLQSMHRNDLSPAQLAEWSALYNAGSKAESNREFDAALKQFRAAALIDDHHADLLYRIAR
ncbi:MAG TPA: hypothetical protein VK530_20180, partial [Candidatus Acidoferrum sp.]|nr:hypothetical protein [Candidatus Acidoferrum sp.]